MLTTTKKLAMSIFTEKEREKNEGIRARRSHILSFDMMETRLTIHKVQTDSPEQAKR